MAADSTWPDGDGLPENVVADLLANDRRRRALEVLVERSDPVVVGDLAATVLAEERGESIDELPAEVARVARDEFFQDHLPKLTATGVVEYDSLVGTVALTDESTVVEWLDDY